jgi:hypothetical protein
MDAISSEEYDSKSDAGSEAEQPNRWQGPSSTWRHLNSEEIDTVKALNEIRNRDLSIHLYNAFALKQRHTIPVGENGAPVPAQVWA